MARFAAATPILDAASTWRDRCLQSDGSIFTDERLWTPEHIGAMDRYFIQNLDEGEGDFLTKLEHQLARTAPEVKKLAAEMLWTLYLIMSEGAMSAETKRFQIRKVWAWSGEELPEDHPMLGDLLDRGVSHTGTGYHTNRWRELVFLILTVQSWKALDGTRRAALLNDPWAFAEWFGEPEHAKGRQFRHILLFLLFPDTFERMATGSHKQSIITAFQKSWGEEPKKIKRGDSITMDRELLRVRERLAEYDRVDPASIDFYHRDYAHVWREPKGEKKPSDTTRWPDAKAAEAWLQERFGDARIWMVGAAGGRIWPDFLKSGIIAIGPDYVGDLTEYESRDAIAAAITAEEGRANPRNDSLACWQIAQDMQIGDIVIARQGKRRLLGWGKVTGDYQYDTDRGEYQHTRAVEWKVTKPLDLVGDQRGIATKALTEFRQFPSWTKWALETMGQTTVDAPASTDSTEYTTLDALREVFLTPKELTRILDSLARRKNIVLHGPPGVGKTFLARRIAYALIGRRDKDRVQMVQFHQSTAYEDFIQGFRPTADGGFVLRNGVFHNFCTRAAADHSDTPWVFVVDEINRGNLSRIFGELLMLIEADKRGPEHAIPLNYSPEATFHVPENVHLIGLMNTADRSLAMVDYALRRRFGFIGLHPAFGKDSFREHLLAAGVADELVRKIDERMAKLNDAIRADRKNLGPGYEIGHSYFVPSDQEDALDDGWYENVIDTEIHPLLQEYWFDDPAIVDTHVRALRT